MMTCVWILERVAERIQENNSGEDAKISRRLKTIKHCPANDHLNAELKSNLFRILALSPPSRSVLTLIFNAALVGSWAESIL
jgi:hypothetical protein